MIKRTNPIFLWAQYVNKPTLICTILLIIIGIILSVSLSYAASEKVGLKGTTFFAKHFVFSIVAFCIIIFLSAQNTLFLKIFCFIGLFFTLFGLILTLYGSEIKGATRWINILGFSLQPSELLKPFYIYICSIIFTNIEFAKIRLKNIKIHYLALFGLHSVIMLLLFLQPDFGMIVTFNLLFIILFYINVKSIKLFLIGVLVLLFFGVIAGFFLDHVRTRIINFLFGVEGYQVRLSIEAILNGGFTGAGFSESKLKFILPEAHNDFIFAIMLEEFGFFSAIILGCIFVYFVFVNFLFLINYKEKISKAFKRYNYFKKPDEADMVKIVQQNQQHLSLYTDFLFARNFITLTCVLIFFEFFFNASVSLNLVPTKGMAMPFISYGGSSLIAHGILVGLLLFVNKKRYIFIV